MGELQGCSEVAVSAKAHDPDTCSIQQGVNQVTNSQAGRESIERYVGRLFCRIAKREFAFRFLFFTLLRQAQGCHKIIKNSDVSRLQLTEAAGQLYCTSSRLFKNGQATLIGCFFR